MEIMDNKHFLEYVRQSLIDRKKTNNEYSDRLHNIQKGGSINSSIQHISHMKQNLPETSKKIYDIVDLLKSYNNNIDDLIKQIDTEHGIGFMGKETMGNDLGKIKEKILLIKETINNKIKNITSEELGENILIKTVDADKQKWTNLINIFKLFIRHYDSLLSKLQNKDIEPITEEIYNEINALKNRMTKFRDYIKTNSEYMKKQLGSINLINSTYDPNEIILVENNKDVYQFYTRINIKETISKSATGLLIQEQYNLEKYVIDMIKLTYGSDKNDKSDDTEMENIIRDLPNIFKKPINAKVQIGGDKIHDINRTILEIVNFLDELNNNLHTYKLHVVAYNQYSIRYNNYMLYILSILTLQKYKFKDNVLLFSYINKGLLQMYLMIIKDILEKIRGHNDNPIYSYFDRYHYFTLGQLELFIEYILTKYIDKVPEDKKTTFIINVKRSTGKAKFMFTLLGHFKDILDSYKENIQKQVTIYARINDWGTTEKMFTIDDKKDLIHMKINTKPCATLTNGPKERLKLGNDPLIRFTEVYDTERYPDNETISSYMMLAAQLSKGKGVFLMTYGYSGTGKTFTLFGNKETQGMLQSTLNSIRGMEEIGFRSYEIYGQGVAYPHYWKSNIYQKIYEHSINIENDEIKFIKSIEHETSSNYLTTGKYLKITENQVKLVFKDFANYTTQLDDERKGAGRIRITPNNPESSRSIVVYDFIILVDDNSVKKYIPFVIIDLPGREEITQTYVETYLKKPFIPKEYTNEENGPFYKALLGSIAVNPLGLAFLVPSMIFETMNDLGPEEENKILNNIDGKTINFFGQSISIGNVKIPTSMATYYSGIPFKLGDNPFYKVTKYDPHNQKQVLKINTEPSSHPKHVPTATNSIQYQCVVAMFVINSLIANNRFDILEKLYKKIKDTYLNMQSVFNSIGDKKTFLKQFMESKKVDELDPQEVEVTLDNMINFKYFLAQHEGIYINENIMGLLKHLIRNVLPNNTDEDTRKIIPLQPEDLDFDIQKKNYRHLNFYLYSSEKDAISGTDDDIGETSSRVSAMVQKKETPVSTQTKKNVKSIKFENKDYEVYENIYRNKKLLNELYKNALGEEAEFPEVGKMDGYSSKKIFTYDNPYMGTVIDFYMGRIATPTTVPHVMSTGKRSNDGIEIKNVTDIKIFYLFSNTSMELKCAHQYDLLANTISLIKAVEN